KGYAPAENALIQAGYTPIRISYDMQINMEAKPTVPSPPDGFKIRTYNGDDDLEAFVHAFRDSFSDHFGYIEEPFEKDYEEFKHWFATDTQFDPELFAFVIDTKTNEIAGYTLGLKQEHGNP